MSAELRPQWLVISVWAMAAVIGSPAARGDDAPDLNRELTWARLEQKIFNTNTIYHLGVQDTIAWWNQRIEEKRAKQAWIHNEARAFARLNRELTRDMDFVTKARDDLRLSSLDAARFVSGNEAKTKRYGFRKLVELVSHAPEVRRELGKEAPSISAGDFRSHIFADLVEANGELQPPPQTLLAERSHGPGRAFLRTFSKNWQLCAEDLTAGREVPEERLAAMLGAVKGWRRWLEQAQAKPGPSELLYLDRCDALVGMIAEPRTRLALEKFLKNRGHAFEGGTGAELLEYVMTHGLQPRPGTRAHLVLGGITNEMVEKAKADASVLERRLEELKAQSPAHNAVLRQRMVPATFNGPQSGANAGLDSPAFGKLNPPPALPAVMAGPMPFGGGGEGARKAGPDQEERRRD